MSSKGIFSAVSGAIAQSQRLDTISNNLANVNTPGFKRDEQVFQEYLSAYEKQQDVLEVPRGPASVESFYNLQGADRSYVDSKGSYTSFQQGAIKSTGNAFDLALEGNAFFEIQTLDGVRYTRNGTFTNDAEGRLVTKDGYPVLMEGQGAPETRILRVGPQGKIGISSNGQIFQGENNLGRLSVVEVDNLQGMKKVGNSFFTLNEVFNPQVRPALNFKLHQGYIETSNVNAVKEMTDLIQATRLFESTQKAIQAYDKMDQKLYNDVAKIGGG